MAAGGSSRSRQSTLELFDANQNIDLVSVGHASQIVTRVIHGHHEVQEERIVFPVVEKSAGLQKLTATLRGQHNAARAITAVIGQHANAATLRDTARKKELVTAMRNFMNMYQPHGAFEDTIVYPAFRQALSMDEYSKLAEQFEQDEVRVNGKNGFHENATALARIEATLGIDLARYTRQMESPVDSASTGPRK